MGLNNQRTQLSVDFLMPYTEIDEEAGNFAATQHRNGPERSNTPKSGSEKGV